VIRKLGPNRYRLYSQQRDPKTGRRKNLGTFRTRAEAERHERAVQFFKRRKRGRLAPRPMARAAARGRAPCRPRGRPLWSAP